MNISLTAKLMLADDVIKKVKSRTFLGQLSKIGIYFGCCFKIYSCNFVLERFMLLY